MANIRTSLLPLLAQPQCQGALPSPCGTASLRRTGSVNDGPGKMTKRRPRNGEAFCSGGTWHPALPTGSDQAREAERRAALQPGGTLHAPPAAWRSQPINLKSHCGGGGDEPAGQFLLPPLANSAWPGCCSRHSGQKAPRNGCLRQGSRGESGRLIGMPQWSSAHSGGLEGGWSLQGKPQSRLWSCRSTPQLQVPGPSPVGHRSVWE